MGGGIGGNWLSNQSSGEIANGEGVEFDRLRGRECTNFRDSPRGFDVQVRVKSSQCVGWKGIEGLEGQGSMRKHFELFNQGKGAEVGDDEFAASSWTITQEKWKRGKTSRKASTAGEDEGRGNGICDQV